jgi:tetratricopeptide (TPR) repeat protein
MSSSLESLILKAKQFARSGDNQKALSLADELVGRYPNEMEAWSLRGHLHARNHNYQEALADVTRAIDANPFEPSLFFDRGRYELVVGKEESAVTDFSKGLELCDHHKDDYYRESLYFFRAEAFLRLGRKHEALEDLVRVRDDFKTWIDKVRTKADLLADCDKLSG